MTEAVFSSCKAALNNLIACDKVYESEDPYSAFSEGILNFYSHYCEDAHNSTWCFHEKVYRGVTTLANNVTILYTPILYTGERWQAIPC